MMRADASPSTTPAGIDRDAVASIAGEHGRGPRRGWRVRPSKPEATAVVSVAHVPVSDLRPAPRHPADVDGSPAPAACRCATAIRAYVSLTKPRIVELLLVTTVPAMVLAAGGVPSLGLVAVVLVGGSLAAGAANALNCYIDRDIDEVMRRTSRRPLPAHTVAPRSALVFGLVLAVVSTVLMAVFTNWLATALTVAAIVYYDLDLHAVAEADHAAEHVLGRRVRGHAGADRLGRGHRLARPAGAGSCSASCSSGRCRTSTRSRSGSRTTTRGPASRCCRWSRSLRRVGLESVVFAWLTVLTSLVLWPSRAGLDLRRCGAGRGRRCSCSRPTAMHGRIRRDEPVAADAAVPLVHDVPHDRVRGDRGGRPRRF